MVRILFFVLSSFLPLSALFSQGLVPSHDKYLRDYIEEAILLKKENALFAGYYLTSFERPEYVWKDGARSEWFAPLTQKFFVRPSLNFASYREQDVRVVTMGSTTFPVTQSSLLEGAQGLPLRYGENSYAGIEAEAHPTDWSFFRLQMQGGVGSDEPQAWYFIQQLYTELRFNRFVLSVGRKPIYWGQSHIGPILYSDNAKSLDSIGISTLPLRWPWIFKYLGDLKAEMYFSRLDSKRAPANDYFLGWRLGIKPSDWFEGNLGMIYQFLGKGMRGGAASDFFLEFLGVRQSYSENPHDSSNLTNRGFAGDFRVNIQNLLWPTSIYTEQHLEDCCGEIGSLIRDTLSYNFGVLTRTSKNPNAHRLRLEYAKTGTNLYVHNTWPASTSNAQRIAGIPLGRDAQGVYLDWSRDWIPFGVDSNLGIFWEQRERTEVVQRFDDGTLITIYNYRPDFKHSEKRYGIRSSGKVSLGDKIFLDLGSEFVRVTGKENSDRKTLEWGLYSSLSRSW